MLALEAKVEMNGWANGPRLAKIAGIREFAAGDHPIERMLLDLRDETTRSRAEAMLDLPWAGFVVHPGQRAPAGRLGVSLLGEPAIAKPGDVVELQPERSKLATRYRRGVKGNVLFATERCNSFCVMCSQPPRPIQDDWRTEHLCDLIDLIDSDETNLAISGGEPTLLGDGLGRIVRKAAEALPHTKLHILSNGRRFGDDFAAAPFKDCHPSLSWGIPLYGDVPHLHDYVVQSRGAHAQTMRGFYALHDASQRIEVRIVLVKPVVERLPQLARYISRNLPFVDHVAFMGVEPIGFALANRDALWLDPVDAAPALGEAIELLDSRGIACSLYNTPLCVLPRSLWPFARRSISDWKQDYLKACGSCSVCGQCSGVFGWEAKGWQSRAIAPITEGMAHA